MTSQRWRERLLSELRRQRLPARYRDRLLEEWTDHAIDLLQQQEHSSMDAESLLDQKMGTPTELARAARREYRPRSLARRHPVWAFLVAPLPVVFMAFVVFCLLSFGCGMAITALAARLGGPAQSFVTDADNAFAIWLHYGCRFVPFTVAAVLFSYLARKGDLHWWSFASCCIIAALAATFHSQLLSTDGRTTGWSIGFGTPLGLNQLAQVALPLLLAIGALRTTTGARPWRPRVPAVTG